MNNTNNVDYYESIENNNKMTSLNSNKRKLTCKEYCNWKFCLCSTILSIVFIVIGALATYLMFYVISGNDTCIVPNKTCSGFSPSITGYYNAEHKFSVGFTYKYAVNFEKNITIPFNDSLIELGTMHSCVQTFDAVAVGPFNCSMNYMYDHSNCAFHYLNGDCDIQVSHKDTDNMLTSMQYDSNTDSLIMDFFSHSKISGGSYNLTRSDTSIITCDKASNLLPKELCPKTSFIQKLALAEKF